MPEVAELQHKFICIYRQVRACVGLDTVASSTYWRMIKQDSEVPTCVDPQVIELSGTQLLRQEQYAGPRLVRGIEVQGWSRELE